MLYFITFLLVLIIIGIIKISWDQKSLQEGQMLITHNQRQLRNDIDAVSSTVNSIKSQNQNHWNIDKGKEI